MSQPGNAKSMYSEQIPLKFFLQVFHYSLDAMVNVWYIDGTRKAKRGP